MRLPRGTTIDVLTLDGAAHVGALVSVDRSVVRVLAGAIQQDIARVDVARIDLVDLPGSEAGAVAKQAGIGAALGVGAAALLSGVIGGSAWPPPGVLVRSGAAIGGIAGGSAAIGARSPRLVYLAEDQRAASFSANNAPATPTISPRVVRTIVASDAVSIDSLTEGELVRIVRRGGIAHRGVLLDVADGTLRLDVDGAQLLVPRASIVRIEILEETGG